jgi:predicted nucleic acid-binding Zn ribbon protein
MTDKLPDEPSDEFCSESTYRARMGVYIDALRAAYEAQKAEIATLRGKGNLAWPCDKCGHCFEVCDHEKESAERRVAELEAALKKYGSHSNGCARVITFAATCTCGFDEAMSGGKGKCERQS